MYPQREKIQNLKLLQSLLIDILRIVVLQFVKFSGGAVRHHLSSRQQVMGGHGRDDRKRRRILQG